MTTSEKPARRKRKPRGMGSLYQKRAVWWLSFTHNGVRHAMSCETRLKGEAVRFRERVFADLQYGRFAPGSGKVTLTDLKAAVFADHDANGLRSKERAKQAFAHLERLLGAGRLADQIGVALPSYIQARLTETVGPTEDEEGNAIEARKVARGSVNRELGYLRRGYKLLIQHGRLAVMPHIVLLEENNVRTGFPTPAEIERIVAALPERLQGPVRFASITGWRAREVFGLQWRHVDMKQGMIRLEGNETKGGEVRLLPYAEHPVLAELIAGRRAATDAWQREKGALVPWVFWFEADGVATPNRYYHDDWKAACEAAGCPGRLFHDLRRYAARNYTRSGVSETVAMKLLGHRTASTFRRYNIVDEGDLRAGLRNLAEVAERPALRTK